MIAMSLLVGTVGAAATTLCSGLLAIFIQQKRKRDAKAAEDRCDRWRRECATSADETFSWQKHDICSMAAEAECSAIFDARAKSFGLKRQLWGRDPPTRRAGGPASRNSLSAVMAKRYRSSSPTIIQQSSNWIAHVESAPLKLFFAGNAALWATGLVIFHIFRIMSSRRCRSQPMNGAPGKGSMASGTAHVHATGQAGNGAHEAGPVKGGDFTIADRVPNCTKGVGGHSVPASASVSSSLFGVSAQSGMKPAAAPCDVDEPTSSTLDVAPRAGVGDAAAVDGTTNYGASRVQLDERNSGVTWRRLGAEEPTDSDNNNSIDGAAAPHFVRFDLLEEDKFESSSMMPRILIAGRNWGRSRCWQLGDLLSSVDDGKARVIGDGRFGTVAQITMPNGTFIAIKRIVRQRKYLGDRELHITREIKLLQECSVHPYIIDCLGVMKTKHTVFVMMPVAATDLGAMIKNGPLDEETTRQFMRQLLSALEFLHAYLIVHRDVKPANLLLADELGGVGIYAGKKLQLADFGFADQISCRKGYHNEPLGTMSYMAPELMLENVHNIKYGEKVDVWAVGVVTHELLTLNTPFRPNGSASQSALDGEAGGTVCGGVEEKTLDDMERLNIQAGRSAFDSSVIGPQCENFLSTLLEFDASERVSAFEAANHPWLGVPGQAAEIRAHASATVAEQKAAQAADKAVSAKPTTAMQRGIRLPASSSDAAGAATYIPGASHMSTREVAAFRGA